MFEILENSPFTIFISPSQSFLVHKTAGGATQTKFGPVRHDDVKHYGQRIKLLINNKKKQKESISNNENLQHENQKDENVALKILNENKTEKFVYILRPNPYDYPHPTAVVQLQDIALSQIFFSLNSKSVVLESGFGSGVYCNHLKSVKKVYSVEIEKERVDLKRVPENCTLFEGDVSKVVVRDESTQKTNDSIEIEMVDAAFLDVPTPVPALLPVSKVLKLSGTLCVYVISVQQTLAVTDELKKLNFKVEVMENVMREYQRTRNGPRLGEGKMHTAYLIIGRRSY